MKSIYSGYMSSGTWCCLVGQEVPSILKDHGAAIFLDEAVHSVLRLLEPWIWRHHLPVKCQEPITQRHGITSQKTLILNSTAMRNLSLARPL